MEKESEKQAKVNKKNRRYKKFIYVIIAVLLIILIICDYVFLIHKSKVLAPNINSESENNISGNLLQNPNSADDYNQNGSKELGNQQYQQAIENFSKAIELDPKNANNYARKSEAEYNLGLKQDAIITVEDGLKQNPDNELLKAKLDLLQKDFIQSSDQETPRE
jgi:tetratricopeptide (TPR) repeat protein